MEAGLALATQDYALTRSWTLVADGKAQVFIERNSSNYVEIHGGQSAPADGAAFITLGRSLTISFADLDATDKIYARAAEGSGNIASVTVLTK